VLGDFRSGFGCVLVHPSLAEVPTIDFVNVYVYRRTDILTAVSYRQRIVVRQRPAALAVLFYSERRKTKADSHH